MIDNALIRFLRFQFHCLFTLLFAVLIEKILRVAPNVGKIFLLIKAKDEQAAMDRVKNEVCVS